jgi:hypothetical protein
MAITSSIVSSATGLPSNSTASPLGVSVSTYASLTS